MGVVALRRRGVPLARLWLWLWLWLGLGLHLRLRLRVHVMRLDVRHRLCGAVNRHGGLRVRLRDGLCVIRARLWLWLWLCLWPLLRLHQSWVRHLRWRIGGLWMGELRLGKLRLSGHLGRTTGTQRLARIEGRGGLRRCCRRDPGLWSSRSGCAAGLGIRCVHVGAHVCSPSLKVVPAHRPSWLMHG